MYVKRIGCAAVCAHALICVRREGVEAEPARLYALVKGILGVRAKQTDDGQTDRRTETAAVQYVIVDMREKEGGRKQGTEQGRERAGETAGEEESLLEPGNSHLFFYESPTSLLERAA
jgi:hypothetical protein